MSENNSTNSHSPKKEDENNETQTRKRLRPVTPIKTVTSNPIPPKQPKIPTIHVSWGKHNPIPLTPQPSATTPSTPIEFLPSSPCLTFHIHATSGYARASTLHLKHGSTPLPIFMPVGTKGSIKGLTVEELDILDYTLILGNTYHLATAPTTPLLAALGGLHNFMSYHKNLLTDSGGFQMVSLAKFTEVSEEGVQFEHPSTGEILMLRPEDSIRHQNNIGADIIMMLDDVVSSVCDSRERFEEATHRTIRWFDRCLEAHERKTEQNLFPIVQGGLDTSVGGLRQICLEAFQERDDKIPGYAIGGLAGGESKDAFWRVVWQSCRALPDMKPRYLMGVGYPLDIVICTALGVDMYDCVYPTRTARFGVALVDGRSPGTMRLKSAEFGVDQNVIMKGCICMACSGGVSRARLHQMLKSGSCKGMGDDHVAVQLMTHHNLAYMRTLTRNMRNAILKDEYSTFVKDFVRMQYPGVNNGGDDVPRWVRDAAEAAQISLEL